MRSPSSEDDPSTSDSLPRSNAESGPNLEQGLEWLAQFGDVLYAYALQRVRSSEVAEDLVQETFLAAISNAESFESKSSPETWLIGILRHKLADHYRRKSRYCSLNEIKVTPGEHAPGVDETKESPDSRWDSPESAMQQAEFQSVMSRCVDDLPDLVRQAFEFRVLDSLETDEICKLLGISNNNLAARLYRARTYVRDCLSRRWF